MPVDSLVIVQGSSAGSPDAGTVAVAPAMTNVPLPHDGPPVIPDEEAIFWTPAWLAGEKESLAEYARGGGRSFKTAREVVRYLISDEDID